MRAESAGAKSEKQYAALTNRGMSKERAANIANSSGVSKPGGKTAGSRRHAKQVVTPVQHRTASRKTGKAAAEQQ
jgi:hypothetical protein